MPKGIKVSRNDLCVFICDYIITSFGVLFFTYTDPVGMRWMDCISPSHPRRKEAVAGLPDEFPLEGVFLSVAPDHLVQNAKKFRFLRAFQTAPEDADGVGSHPEDVNLLLYFGRRRKAVFRRHGPVGAQSPQFRARLLDPLPVRFVVRQAPGDVRVDSAGNASHARLRTGKTTLAISPPSERFP